MINLWYGCCTTWLHKENVWRLTVVLHGMGLKGQKVAHQCQVQGSRWHQYNLLHQIIFLRWGILFRLEMHKGNFQAVKFFLQMLMKIADRNILWKLQTELRQVDFEDTNLALAARAVRMAVKVIKDMIPAGTLERSLLAKASSMSTSCTGVYTSEVAMAIVEPLADIIIY